MSHGRRLLLTLGILPATILGYVIVDKLGVLEDLYGDLIGPFLVMYWFGLLFSNMYFYLREDLLAERASESVIAAVSGGLALMFFVAGGGPAILWRDPWLFGAAVMPGVDIAWPFVRRFLEARIEKMRSTAESTPTSAPDTPTATSETSSD